MSTAATWFVFIELTLMALLALGYVNEAKFIELEDELLNIIRKGRKKHGR